MLQQELAALRQDGVLRELEHGCPQVT